MMTFQEINETCENKYPNYKGIIYYLDDSWKKELEKFIL